MLKRWHGVLIWNPCRSEEGAFRNPNREFWLIHSLIHLILLLHNMGMAVAAQSVLKWFVTRIRRNGSSSNSTVVSSTSPWDDDHRFHSRNFTSIVKLGYPTRNQGNNGNGIVQRIWFSKYATATATASGGDGRQFLGMTDEELMRECDMDTFKSSGPGGQHRNKRESAVRLKHLPTGSVAQVICLLVC